MLPKIDLSQICIPLTTYEAWISHCILNDKGCIRETRPFEPAAYYVWRKVVHSVSSNPEHQKTPVLLDAGLWSVVPGWRNMDERTRDLHRYRLDDIATAIIGLVPFEHRPKSVKFGTARAEE